MKIAIYPGSFDPITNGHIDILKRALGIFDKIILAIGVNENKQSRFSNEEKKKMVEESLKELKINNVNVEVYEGLTIDFAKKHHAKYLIRGIRTTTDFKYEFYMAEENNKLDPNIDMIFFMANPSKLTISSSHIMKMYDEGKDISNLVPQAVIKHLRK